MSKHLEGKGMEIVRKNGDECKQNNKGIMAAALMMKVDLKVYHVPAPMLPIRHFEPLT